MTNRNVIKNHLCGSPYSEEGRCPSLLYNCEDGAVNGKKTLRKYYLYCTAEGKCRSLGNIASFTGNSPTWCPIRRSNDG